MSIMACRGIPCEVWKVHYPETPELEQQMNTSLDYYYYFPVDQARMWPAEHLCAWSAVHLVSVEIA